MEENTEKKQSRMSRDSPVSHIHLNTISKQAECRSISQHVRTQGLWRPTPAPVLERPPWDWRGARAADQCGQPAGCLLNHFTVLTSNPQEEPQYALCANIYFALKYRCKCQQCNWDNEINVFKIHFPEICRNSSNNMNYNSYVKYKHS